MVAPSLEMVAALFQPHQREGKEKRGGREEKKKERDRFADDTRRKFRIMLAGLNQRGLCEESGHIKSVDMEWHADEEPADIAAGNGLSFVVSRLGNIFSWGNGRYGALGHGDEESTQVPTQNIIKYLFHLRYKATI